MPMRLAKLDDTHAISQLFRDSITRWQRIRPDGYAEDLPYEQLSLYERWLHGGAWMSIETASLWLSHVLCGAGMPYVLTDEAEQIVAYAETFADTDDHAQTSLHIAHIIAHDEASRHGLMQYLIQQAKGYDHLTSACSAYDEQQIAFYQHYGMTEWRSVQRVNLAALTGQAFYKTTPHPRADASQIKGWRMPVGNGETSRYHWEALWHNHWRAIPEITAQRIHRLHFNASGQDAYLCFQQHLYDPRAADVYCWTPRPFSTQLLVAIRDWAHREGYRTLSCFVSDAVVKVLGDAIEPQPQRQIIYRTDGV